MLRVRISVRGPRPLNRLERLDAAFTQFVASVGDWWRYSDGASLFRHTLVAVLAVVLVLGGLSLLTYPQAMREYKHSKMCGPGQIYVSRDDACIVGSRPWENKENDQ